MPRKSVTAYAGVGEIIDTVIVQRQNSSRVDLYLNDPVAWARDVLGVHLWSRQAQIAMSVANDHDVVVKASHAAGKSLLAALLICWWIDTRWQLPGGCFVVSTAPSTKQINAVVWKEVRTLFQTSKKRYAEYLRRSRAGLDLGEYQWADHELPGYITSQAHWRLESGIELGYGTKPPDAKEDTMSGVHGRVLAIGDEAVGLSAALIEDLGNITSSEDDRLFLICNPTNPLSHVAKMFKSTTEYLSWKKYTISAYESPNFTGEETQIPDDLLKHIVGPDYVQKKLDEWGQIYEDEKTGRTLSHSPKFISRVLGEFAWDQGFTLISSEDMAVGLDTDIGPSGESRPVMGVDVSRSKDGDMNALYVNHDGKLRLWDSWNERNAMKTVQMIHEAALATGVSEVRIDASGLGGPIADQVAFLAEDFDYAVIEMIGGYASPDRARYFNARAYWYASFAEKLRDGELDIDPEDEQLQEELLGIEIKKRTQGVDNLLIESKEDMRKRGIGSPDYADAAIYAVADISGLYGFQLGDQVAYDPEDFFEETMPFFTELGKYGL